MKKYTFIFLIFFVSMMILNACSAAPAACSAAPAASSTAPNQQALDPSMSYLTLTLKRVSANNPEEYEEVVARCQIADKIIPYDQLSSLGEFSRFTIVDTPSKDENGLLYVSDPTDYIYCFDDETGVDVCVTFVENPFDCYADNNILTEADITPQDMRTNKTASTGIYCIDGVTYRYFDGQLRTLFWSYNGMTVYLYSNYCFTDYPMDAQTVIPQFLNLETVHSAILSLSLWEDPVD